MRLAASLVMVFAAGCSSPGDPATGDSGGSDGGSCFFACLDVSVDAPLVVRVKNILQICANPDGCHGAGAGSLTIASGNEFSSLIDVPSSQMPSLYYVKPGDPAQSYLYLKVACEGGIDGDCMPQRRPDPAIARIFHDWIEAGAPTQ